MYQILLDKRLLDSKYMAFSELNSLSCTLTKNITYNHPDMQSFWFDLFVRGLRLIHTGETDYLTSAE